MKQINRWFLFSLFIVWIGAGCASQSYPWDGDWVLVWEDHFHDSALNLNDWQPSEQGLNYNNEDQAYTNANVTIEDSAGNGILVLTAKSGHWEGPSGRADNPTENVTREYTSGEANTKQSWTYGKFEARARVPKTQGVLSAVWMTPADAGWPPEIDIMEILGHDPATVYFTNHYGTSQNHQMKSSHYTGSDFSNDYHIYTLEWEPGILRWYVDGVKYFESRSGVPGEPFILRLSLPVGPDWEEDPDDTSEFPQRFEIDWVRVYQRGK